ncbi:hypothetical protein [Maridesulfovibrio frigidus]|uniref:hypothetical protein n=1 Tax=Maridesulfovibrio frigidus TaxID=340956 RepID=UPI000AE6E655|nr:hypothetical protein [Maridesulfovibrio frigidus]
MPKVKIKGKTIPVLFDVVVYGGFVAFLSASYITLQSFLERFPEPLEKLIVLLQKILA